MHNNMNVTFNLSSSHTEGKISGLSCKGISKCSNLLQELINSESQENIHLLDPDLSHGYSGNHASLQGNPDGTSNDWIHDNQIQNGNPPVTNFGRDPNSNNNPQLNGKNHGASMSGVIPMLDETTTGLAT